MSTELELVEENIKQARKVADAGDALSRLLSNRDFKEVILKGYFEQEAIRLVHLMSDPNMQKEESQWSIKTQMESIGCLSQYFNTLRVLASMANKNIVSDEQARDELLVEGL